MVSVIMPAYNEAAIIEKTVREWDEELRNRLPGYELIVVDDCSTDHTGDVLARLAREIPAMRAIRPASNGGHGRALRVGFDNAARPWVFQTDSDRQHAPSDFWKLWNVRDSHDFILGVREARADGVTRTFITAVMQLANAAMWGMWIRDANCPFKLMRREPLMAVLAGIPRDSFIPMVMLSILCRRMGYRVAEQQVQHFPRTGGEQSLSGLWKWVKVGSRCLRQLVVWRVSRPARYRRP